MKIKIILSIFVIIGLLMISANPVEKKNIGEVSKIKGFYIFVDSQPLGEYEALGEVVSDDNKDPDIKKSGGQYQAVRDNLIKNARAVNYTADGLILHFVNGGVDKAEIIKFKESEKNKNRAKVEQIQGVYVFVDCTPVAETTYLGTIKRGGGGFSSAQYTAVRDGLMRKSKKEYPDAEAFIIKFVTGGQDLSDAVKFK